MQQLKHLLRRIFYRSASARFTIGVMSLITGRTRSLRVMHLLSYVDAAAVGPLQRPEALLLNALAQVTLPRVVVEFGFFKGHSAFNFLEALPSTARVYSYDTATHAAETAAHAFKWTNFTFLHKSQDQFQPQDIDNQNVDLVFFDAVHDLELNQRTWRLLLSSLSESALIIVHDTGTWPRSEALAIHGDALSPSRWISDAEYEHQPEERQFVNWIGKEYPAYAAIHLHTLTTLRHGLTILQKRQRLPSTAHSGSRTDGTRSFTERPSQ